MRTGRTPGNAYPRAGPTRSYGLGLLPSDAARGQLDLGGPQDADDGGDCGRKLRRISDSRPRRPLDHYRVGRVALLHQLDDQLIGLGDRTDRETPIWVWRRAAQWPAVRHSTEFYTDLDNLTSTERKATKSLVALVYLEPIGWFADGAKG
jgi:hypothetical protein